MRPRSRLLSKRRLLLPTIREGTEETLRDLNEANTHHMGQAVSSEDYLLSICHLAHPTFPANEVSPKDIHTQKLDYVHQRLRGSRPSGTNTSTNFEFRGPIETQHGMGPEEPSSGPMCGSSDPLEYLYGHQNDLPGGVRRGAYVEGRLSREGRARSRAHSIPRASSPELPRRQRKSSCPELHATSTDTLVPHTSPTHSKAQSEAEGGSIAEERHNESSKQSLISQWFSDCRSAWREARVRACMLPAIAEI